jgi:surfactin synthase thioesterase subunit
MGLVPHAAPERCRYGHASGRLYENDQLVTALLPKLRADMAVSGTDRFTDPAPLRWGRASAGGFRSHVLGGGHLYWVSDPAPLVHEVSADLVDSFPPLR